MSHSRGSNENSDSDSEEECAALTSMCTLNHKNNKKVPTFEELAISYNDLRIKSAEIWRIKEKQKKVIEELEVEKRELLAIIAHLNGEISIFNYKLDQMS